MTCKTCQELLGLYDRSVRLYMNAAHNIKGTVGDDFKRAFAEAERLKLACREASDNLMMHWRQKHGNLAVEKPD
jgi:hypothetical protein